MAKRKIRVSPLPSTKPIPLRGGSGPRGPRGPQGPAGVGVDFAGVYYVATEGADYDNPQAAIDAASAAGGGTVVCYHGVSRTYTNTDPLVKVVYVEDLAPKRCLKTEFVTKPDKFGGDAKYLHLTNGHVGISLDYSVFASMAAHDIKTVINGRRALSCGLDYWIKGDTQTGDAGLSTMNWGDMAGPRMWGLPTAVWFEDEWGIRRPPSSFGPDDTMAKVCKTTIVGFVNGTDRRYLDYVIDAPLCIRAKVGDQIVDDPTEGWDPTSGTDTVAFRNGAKPIAYFVPILIDRGKAVKQVSASFPVTLEVYVPAAPAEDTTIYVYPFPSAMCTGTRTSELNGDGNQINALGSVVCRPGDTYPEWKSIPITWGGLQQGMNVCMLVASADITIRTKDSSPGFTNQRNHAAYGLTAGGYDGFVVQRWEGTVYRDHDYIDVQGFIPTGNNKEIPHGATVYGGAPVMNFSWDSDGNYRGVLESEHATPWPFTAGGFNRIKQPDGTILENPTRFDMTQTGATFLDGPWEFWYDDGDGREQLKWSFEKVEDGTKQPVTMYFGKINIAYSYYYDGLLTNPRFNSVPTTGWTVTGTVTQEADAKYDDCSYGARLDAWADDAALSQSLTVKSNKRYSLQFYHRELFNSPKLQIKAAYGANTVYWTGAAWSADEAYIDITPSDTFALGAYVFTTPDTTDAITLTVKFLAPAAPDGGTMDLTRVELNPAILPYTALNDVVMSQTGQALSSGQYTPKFRLDLSNLARELA